uniref:phenylalanine--tRNA ligase n=1 Tax=Hirondellea gigas TaxID=1518452 RepID=A0A2P2I4I7_9CRUS
MQDVKLFCQIPKHVVNMGSQHADLPTQLLIEIDRCGQLNSLKYSQSISEQHQKIVGAIKSLESLGEVINVVSSSAKCWSCTEEGHQISKEGSHEARLFVWLPKDGASVDDIKKTFPSANVALGACLKNKWVRKEGPLVLPAVPSISDQVQQDLQAVASGSTSAFSDKQLADYKKRKLIKDSDVTVFTVSKGPQFTTSISKQDAQLTKEMIESGQWRNKTFKPFNFRSKGKQDVRPGHLHPLMQLRSEFRQIFLEMGFSEMPTNSYVESAFWNFDALFQPQQHPARDAHDTFYVKTPGRAISVPQEYMQRVREVHSNGGYGSSGYRYPWSEEEAHKNLLRTHTTAVSARMLHKLAQDGFKPAKYFSIDRVFRNETLDATHLAEFQQIEGVVADYNLSVKHLIGMFTAFYEKIGIKKLRFKSTYNPYTEPSMEIYSYHDGLGKWVEVGNSGLFRPEMLRPMGLPENVSVLGWGLSLERPAMIMFGINNIRELVGPRVKMELVYSNPLCTVDKFQGSSLPPPGQAPAPTLPATTHGGEKQQQDCRLKTLACRQDSILQELSSLQQRIQSVAVAMAVRLDPAAAAGAEGEEAVCCRPTGRCCSADPTDVNTAGISLLTGAPSLSCTTELVVTADPRRPPHCLPALLTLLSRTVPTAVRVHSHNTVPDIPASVKNFLREVECADQAVISVRLIWSTAPANSSIVGSSGNSNKRNSCVSAAMPNFKNMTFSSSPAMSRVLSIKGKSIGSPIQVPRLVVSPLTTTEIAGENNICRYLGRLVEVLWREKQQAHDGHQRNDSEVPLPLYEGLQCCLVSECDAWLDDCQSWLITGSNRGRANFLNKLSNKLGETEDGNGNLLSQKPTLADLFVSSSLAVLGKGRVALNVAAWRDRCNSCWGPAL